jgi:hypothetical protein
MATRMETLNGRIRVTDPRNYPRTSRALPGIAWFALWVLAAISWMAPFFPYILAPIFLIAGPIVANRIRNNEHQRRLLRGERA